MLLKLLATCFAFISKFAPEFAKRSKMASLSFSLVDFGLSLLTTSIVLYIYVLVQILDCLECGATRDIYVALVLS